MADARLYTHPSAHTNTASQTRAMTLERFTRETRELIVRKLSHWRSAAIVTSGIASLGIALMAMPSGAVFNDDASAQAQLSATAWGGTMTLNYAVDSGDCQTISLGMAGTKSGSIFWGDGTQTAIATASHTYATPGQYSVDVVGTFAALNEVAASAKCLTSVSRWDTGTGTTNLVGAFKGASNLRSVKEIPRGVVNMTAMFQEASLFNGDLSAWDTSKVTTTNKMFYQATSFNGAVNAWDVSQVTDMTSMFDMAFTFNQPVDSWDVSKVKNMTFLFASTLAFNQPLDTWRTSALTAAVGVFYNAPVFNQSLNNWDVSRVGDFSMFFSLATKFNSNITSWNTGNATVMANMFSYASSFNQNLTGWNVRWVTNRASFDTATTAWEPVRKPLFS